MEVQGGMAFRRCSPRSSGENARRDRLSRIRSYPGFVPKPRQGQFKTLPTNRTADETELWDGLTYCIQPRSANSQPCQPTQISTEKTNPQIEARR